MKRLKPMATEKSKLKIGLVLDDSLDKVDGVQQYVIAVGEWLRSEGHDVHYLVGESSRQDLQGLHSLSKNIKVRFNGNRMSVPLPASKTKLKKFLDSEDFDVLHVQLPYSPYLAHRLIMSVSDKCAVIGTFHIIGKSLAVNTATKLLSKWNRKSVRRFDEILSVSAAAQEFAEKSFGVKSQVLPNVFDYKRFHNSFGYPKYPGPTLNIMFLGRLVPRKGCLVLLQAAEILTKKAEVPDFRVLVCGKGPLAPKLKKYASQHGLSEIVEFTGFVSEEDKPRYYASADIVVFPSSGGESFGIVLLEGLASGHGVVLAGDNPGYRSVLIDRPDLLFDAKSPVALADKLTIFLNSPSKRLDARKWGENYSRSFDTQLVGAKLMTVYRQALRKRERQ